jgi:hypothetical protein
MGCPVTMKNGLVIFIYLPYLDVPLDSEVHRCVLFNDIDVIYSVHVILL